MPVFFLILLYLLFTALTMDGRGEALSMIFAPKFSKLTPKGVLEAVGQAFFYLVEFYGDGISSTYGTEGVGKPRVPGSGACS